MTRNRCRHYATLYAIGCLLVSQSSWGEDIDAILPLPQWSDSRDGILNSPNNEMPLLGILLQPEGLLGAVVPEPSNGSNPLTLATEFQTTRADIDLSLFLPDALLGKTVHADQNPVPTPSSSLRFLNEDFLTVCRESPADEHLIDPDNHVSETQKEDLLKFLQFHARDAQIKAFVVVTDRDQAVPSTADLSSIASGSLNLQDSCLAVYPLGEPWRARLFLTASIHKMVPADYLNNVVTDCAKDAALVTDSLEQLHRFTVRLSIRLFWLEKLIGSNHTALTPANHEEIPSDIIVRREAALTEALLENNIPHSGPVFQWWSVVFGVLLSLAGGGAAYATLYYRRRRLLKYVWMLPDIEVPPRLGGAFSGGGGAWIQYR